MGAGVGIGFHLMGVATWNAGLQVSTTSIPIAVGLVAFNAVLQVLFHAVYIWFFISFLLTRLGLVEGLDVQASMTEATNTVFLYLGVPFLGAVATILATGIGGLPFVLVGVFPSALPGWLVGNRRRDALGLGVQPADPVLPFAFGLAASAMFSLVLSEMIPESRANEGQRLSSAVATMVGFLALMILQNVLVV